MKTRGISKTSKTAGFCILVLCFAIQTAHANSLKKAYAEMRELIMNETILNLEGLYQDASSEKNTFETWRLSLKESTALVLKNNADIKIAYIGTDTTERNIEKERAAFYPTTTGSIAMSRTRTPAANGIDLSSANESVASSLGFSQKLPTGGTVSVDLDSNRRGRKHAFTSDFGVSVSQPIFEGFGGVSLTNIRIAQKNFDIALQNIRSTIITQISNTQIAYWEIVNAQESLKVRQKAYEQAIDFVKQSKREMQLGNRSSTDVLEAEATAAAREVSVIQAQNALESAQDSLKKILNVTDLDLWNAQLEAIETVDAYFLPIIPDTAESVERAFENRPDYLQILSNTKIDMLNLKVARNELLPDLTLEAGYNLNGAGSSSRNNLENLFEQDHHDWNVGLSVSLPWFDVSDREAYQQEKNDLKVRELQVLNLQLLIIQEVRSAVRNVRMAAKEVKAADLSYELQKKKVDAVLKRYSLGAASSFEVLSFQDDLATEGVSRARSIVDYYQALIRLWQKLGVTLDENGITFESEES